MKNIVAYNMHLIMIERNIKIVWYGDISVIEECAIRSNIGYLHPKKRIQRVLNALDRSTLFTKGYINADFSGTNRRYRTFTLNI